MKYAKEYVAYLSDETYLLYISYFRKGSKKNLEDARAALQRKNKSNKPYIIGTANWE